MPRSIRTLSLCLVSLTLLLGSAACSSEPAAKPITLRIGTDDDAQAPAAQQIQHFAAEVATRSHGAITVEPVWHAAGTGVPHWDQAVAKLVTGGKLDLGMIPSRAFDDLGVTSLRALNTPFLITTDTLTTAVVGDPGLTGKLTSGLPAAGVTALGLYPEGLRHPFGFDGPLRGAADYRGAVVRMAWSRTENSMFEALGARTTDDEADETTMAGAESSYRLSPAGVATGNVVFYPKVNVLVASRSLSLTDEQRAVLQASAAATGRWVTTELPTDEQAARTFCSEGGKIAEATPAQVDSLVTATAPLARELRQDPTTAAIIDAVAALKQKDAAASYVTSCGAPAPDTSVNGTYAFTVTPDQARRAGVTDEGVLAENTGDFTWTFTDGAWSLDQVYATGPKAGTKDHISGNYTLSKGHLQIFWSHDPGAWTKMDVAASGGGISFSNVHDGGDAQAQALSEAWFTTWRVG